MKIITPGDPGFYINRRRWHERESHMAVGVEGIYTLRAIKPGVGVVRETSFHNLITNLGMDAIGTGAAWNCMHLGTGTTPPSVTDTGLANFGVAITSSTSARGVSPAPPYYGYLRITWTSSVGGATGTWTEIGISNQTTNGNLRSRELIRDNLGNPTSFPVQSDEQFEGTYELRFYAPESDVVADISLSGVTYTTTTRPLRVTDTIWAPVIESPSSDGRFYFRTGSMSTSNNCAAMSGDLGAVTDFDPSATLVGTGSTSLIAGAYVPGSHQRDYGLRFGSGVAVGSINVLRLCCVSTAWQVKYHTPVNKLATEEFIHNQRFSWARR